MSAISWLSVLQNLSGRYSELIDSSRNLYAAFWYGLFPLVFATSSAYSFGLVPDKQIIDISTWANPEGYAACARHTGSWIVRGCDYLAHPVGSVLFEDATTRTLAYWLGTLTPLSDYASFQIAGLSFLFLGVIGCIGLSSLFYHAHWPGSILAIIYLLSAAAFLQPGIPQLTYGAVLLPFLLWILLRQIQNDLTVRSILRTTLTGVLLGLIIVNISGYSYLFFATIFLPLGAILTAKLADRYLGRTLLIGGAALGIASAGLIQRFLLLPSTGLNPMPIDFYRASSIDLLGFLLPQHDNVLWSIIPTIDFTLSPNHGLYYNGAPFLGYSVIVVILFGIMRRDELQRVKLGLILTIVFLIAISMGPSLRVGNPWSKAAVASTLPGFATHMMPAELVVTDFPWAKAFTLPPLAFARAVFRWQTPLQLVLGLASVTSLVSLIRTTSLGVRRRRLALMLPIVIFLILETIRPTLFTSGQEFSTRYGMLENFRADVVRPLDRDLPTGARVLYLPTGNDHLAPAVGPLIGVRTYNIDGDKNALQARAGQPIQVIRATRRYSRGDTSTKYLRDLLSGKAVDVIVLNDYSLRWSTRRWPPPESEREALRDQRRVVRKTLLKHCTMRDRPFFTIIFECSPQ